MCRIQAVLEAYRSKENKTMQYLPSSTDTSVLCCAHQRTTVFFLQDLKAPCQLVTLKGHLLSEFLRQLQLQNNFPE
jgi:hypothetical protein